MPPTTSLGSIQDLDEGTPEPIDQEDQNAITKTSDVTRLDDGRLAYSIGIGYVYPDDSNEYVTDSYFQIIAVEQGGKWKIDDLLFYQETGAARLAAAPTALMAACLRKAELTSPKTAITGTSSRPS